MSSFILVVDSDGELTEGVRAAVEGAEVRVVDASDVTAAKRMLIQAAPTLIVSHASIGDTEEAGLHFCRELQQHPELSAVPVILVSGDIGEENIRAATDSGAKGMLLWPCAPSALRSRFAAFIPDLANPLEEEAPVESKAAPQPAASPPPGEKIQLVQRLLAQVLHGLKTSDLLEIVELEDVPRVVHEMTRTVCAEHGAPPAGTEKKAEGETSVDLDSAFGFKK